ncbi:DUF2971 domain-containing protein [Psychromonas sp. 14N.309.X.WAT.B.A12]|uniref:DUF2971 domain-containing protein n=1 Tax=Psychromonas sp. 14N.309.X.WAT.B.A12 TaxID=2998322 RepID=UPI0025AF04DD|nr:DUF2971 domain-containing protein [Psychromonas sp. 14N.309.X.WAT.B.A12]MDN2662648.1 DUF2971 domain-containing protein [Psychromonas sp. 14N.309.X.WAT.B.A12]
MKKTQKQRQSRAPVSRALCAMEAVLNIPKKLYKYESVSVQSLVNLKSQTVYFAPPSGFNDPYDCALKAQIAEPTDSEIESLREVYLAKDCPKEVKEKLDKASLKELKPGLFRTAKDASEQIIDNFIRSRGVSCFSEVSDELLMWAHYADKYTGFCLEFSTNHELFERARKVDYVENIPLLNIKSIYADGDRDEMMNLFCTKSKSWAYEKEWRVIHSDAGTAYTYPPEILTGVYFGPNMPFEMLEIICLVLKGQNPHVKLYRGKRSELAFKVEFEEFNYTPYIETPEGSSGT